MRNLIDFGDMSREEWEQLYARASQIIDAPEKFIDVCRGKVSCNLFYEPSTRTNFSFQTAMLRLGGSVFGFADPNSSSVAKGETLKDTPSKWYPTMLMLWSCVLLGRVRPRQLPSIPQYPWSMPVTAATCTPPRPWPI